MKINLPEGRILCAVSGGLDSMCLLQLCLEQGRELVCAHFDHGLRPESAGEQAFVAEWCGKRQIPFVPGRWERPDPAGGEAAARQVRYAFLEQARQAQNCRWIATAHNADDQAETMLLQLCRGTGSRGLSGIPPRAGHILRPLLGIRRAALEQYAAKRGIPHVEDASNGTDIYARNRLRHHVLPVLETVNPAFLAHFSACGDRLREDDDCLYSLAADFLQQHPETLPTAALLALHPAVRGRVYRLVAGRGLQYVHVTALDRLCQSANGKRVEIPGGVVWREGDCLRFTRQKPTAGWEAMALQEGLWVVQPETGWRFFCEKVSQAPEIHNSFNTFYFSCESICGKMFLRPRSGGEHLRLPGRGCTKSLKKLLAEAAIPIAERAFWPVVTDKDRRVIAVPGIGPESDFLAHEGQPAVRITWERNKEEPV